MRRTGVHSTGNARGDATRLIDAHCDEVHGKTDEERAEVVPPQVTDEHGVDQNNRDDR